MLPYVPFSDNTSWSFDIFYDQAEHQWKVKVAEGSEGYYQNIEDTIQAIENDIHKNSKEIIDIKQKYLDKYGEIKDIQYIDGIIEENKKLLLEYETKKTSDLETIENIKKYDDYIENNKKYELWKKKLVELQEKEKEDRMRYSASLTFKENILLGLELSEPVQKSFNNALAMSQLLEFTSSLENSLESQIGAGTALLQFVCNLHVHMASKSS